MRPLISEHIRMTHQTNVRLGQGQGLMDGGGSRDRKQWVNCQFKWSRYVFFKLDMEWEKRHATSFLIRVGQQLRAALGPV